MYWKIRSLIVFVLEVHINGYSNRRQGIIAEWTKISKVQSQSNTDKVITGGDDTGITCSKSGGDHR